MSICRPTCLLGLISLILTAPVAAQIAPDTSVGTTVTPDVMVNGTMSDRIDGGTIRGSNLFHSFSEFNIKNGRAAYFTNPEGITNIFSRITGNNPSQINGILGVLGNANLFLLNPNGIIFGPNAQLNMGGSFIGSTASTIKFADGTSFSTTNPAAAPLLTVSVPVGLGLGSNPGEITAQGAGHTLTTRHAEQAAYAIANHNNGLRVQPGRTLALVGGNLTLNGTILNAPGGRIELGSVGEGTVGLNLTSQQLLLDYTGANNFRDIRLQQQSLADVSGVNVGSIQVQGRQVSLNNASVLWAQNRGSFPGGSINVRATESVELSGYIPSTRIRSGLVSETLGGGTGGEINVSTQRLILRDAGGIFNKTFGQGDGGNITLNASELVDLSGFIPNARNNIAAHTFSTGKAGNIDISTRRLFISDGAIIANTTFNRGAGGNITVNSEALELIGSTKGDAALFANSFGPGNAGDIAIDTRTLIVSYGGKLTTSSFSSGDGGDITVNASESVEVSALNQLDGSFSRIRSSVPIASEPTRRVFPGLPNVPSGTSGNLTINTPKLTVTEQGFVSVNNEGVGRGGTLTVNADSVLLSGNGSLSATTASGEAGNINLRSQSLEMRRNSAIAATAGGTGNGGDLTINSNVIVALENSDITANAFQGRGGNIRITTEGLFNSVDSNITASSQLGVSGVVNVSTLNFDRQNLVVQQPKEFIDADSVVAASCLAGNGGSGTFIVTGNGGLPETPSDFLVMPYELVSVRSVAAGATSNSNQMQQQTSVPAISSWKLGDPIVEATEFSINAQGQVVLTAKRNSAAAAHPQRIPCQPINPSLN